MRLLIVDDDVELCSLLQEFLEREGFTVECVHEGHAASNWRSKAATTSSFWTSCCLDSTDSRFSSGSALTSRVPVLMLTARGEDVDRIVGLELGADDYLPKPFNPRELARTRQSHSAAHRSHSRTAAVWK